ncbi:MAG: ABC transporter permease subunit, partial [Gammaproteobacteria bacterium]|nr:ABC transporter permease subunit [Gammaproteobacteria bacterium]
MSVAVPPQSESRSLSALWRDEQIRGVLVQIMVMAALFALAAYLVHNAIANLEALGKTFGFDFLEAPAGYDINQRLIEYDSRSSNLRATIVGVLNTALVAVCGIVLATLMGFTLGVLRLSQNWILSRISYCIVEFCRNVPVLVHILLWHGIIVHSLPRPRNAIAVGDSVFLTNRGIYTPRPLFEPAFEYVVYALIAAIALAFAFARWARRRQDQTGQILPVMPVNAALIVLLPSLVFFIVGTPLDWEQPALRGFNFSGGIPLRPEFVALCWALSLYTACFIAEIVRAGILAVSSGQHEAASALGLRPGWTLRLIVLPQALRVIVPPLTSQYLNLTKN